MLKDFLIITGLSFLQAGVSIYIKTQAQVYIWGRMLDILKSNKSRNLLALVSTIIFTAGHIYSKETESQIFYYTWEFLNWFSMGILIYVLVGFNLFTRVGKLQDIKIAKLKKK